MYERFTDRARKVMQLANQEAQRWNHDKLDTQHLLVALVKEDTGIAAHVLEDLGVELGELRKVCETIVPPGPEAITMGKLPQTEDMKGVIQQAIKEAERLDHNYVGTEHLLLALCNYVKVGGGFISARG